MFNRRKPEDAKPSDQNSEAVQNPPLSPASTPEAVSPEDNGLDVPPFRPDEAFPSEAEASNKETSMARSPFSPVIPPAPTSVLRPPAASVPGPRDTPVPQTADRRTLVVGRGISVQGTVQDAERLVVEGTVEAAMINGLAELAISPGGIFKGEVEVDEAEVAGTIDGTLTARNALIIRATGKVLGTARCHRLQVEDGGQITGRIEMLGSHAASSPVKTSEIV